MFAASLALLGAVPAQRCASLARFHDRALTVVRSETVAGNCKVAAVSRVGRGSRVGMELRLPLSGWTGRYVQLGTGGFAGTIFPDALDGEGARGNVAAMSDSGHVGDRMEARWAAGDRAAVVDYGYRSIRTTSHAARRLIAALYGRAARYRYFVGCSNGGRQALMAAQRYPADWDGVLAGSPANPWSEQLYRFAALQHRLGSLGAGDLSPVLPQVERAALASCPAGSVREGVALDPRRCRFAPARLQLGAAATAAVRAIVAAGYEPTSATGWAGSITGPRPGQAAFASQAFRYLLQSDPTWSVERFDAVSARKARQRLAPLLDVAPDFGPFRRKGGKILSYFGWADPLIAPRLALDFHRSVARANGAAALAGWYRLFMIPGMDHCQGGRGPVDLGQAPGHDGASPDADHDIRAALERWVETGQAPERLIASSGDGDRIELRPEIARSPR